MTCKGRNLGGVVVRVFLCLSLATLPLGGCKSIQDNKLANPYSESRKVTHVDTMYVVPDSANVLKNKFYGLKKIEKLQFEPVTAYKPGGSVWSVTHFLPFDTMASCKSFVHSWAKKFPPTAKTKAFCVQLSPTRPRIKTVPVI